MGQIRHKPLRTSFSVDVTSYSTFDRLDGSHPWIQTVPDGYILYPVRKINYGKVVYFNYDLAIEMGLLPASHPKKMTIHLEKKILETFNLRIINEYDQTHHIKYHPSVMKKNKFMATRYLQLQHDDKKGRTSGDGRSIWNGCITHEGKTWDVSSRGTGVTALSPGAAKAQKPLRTGSTQYGYGCGLADVDELMASAIAAETFYRQNIKTERVLVVIDHGDGNGIGVRAGLNLIRPAHLFLYLKQNDHVRLKKAFDYFIQREINNKSWRFSFSDPALYDKALLQIAKQFAEFTARLDRDYIFAWLDWDGDNVLAQAGIIDYGSIRQFGIRHDGYRYDDEDRFSTNLNEQKNKARQIVQAFAQAIDFIKTGQKKTFHQFSNHAATVVFDKHFEDSVLKFFLKQVGYDELKTQRLLKNHKRIIKSFYHSFFKLETCKVKKKQNVSDGINRPPLLNMRKALVDWPKKNLTTTDPQSLYSSALAEECPRRYKKIKPQTKKMISDFIKFYQKVLVLSFGAKKSEWGQKQLVDGALRENRLDRLKGNALLYIVDELMSLMKTSARRDNIQKLIDYIILQQSPCVKTTESVPLAPSVEKRLSKCLRHIDEHKESI